MCKVRQDGVVGLKLSGESGEGELMMTTTMMTMNDRVFISNVPEKFDGALRKIIMLKKPPLDYGILFKTGVIGTSHGNELDLRYLHMARTCVVRVMGRQTLGK